MKILKTIKCPHCDYTWITKSIKHFVSCPDCLKKINVLENKIKEENNEGL